MSYLKLIVNNWDFKKETILSVDAKIVYKEVMRFLQICLDKKFV